MFAGPNGSGKSTLIEEVRLKFNVGYFINADEIESLLKRQKFLDCTNFLPKIITDQDWENFIASAQSHDKRLQTETPKISLSNNYLICKDPINSYHASVIAEFLRFQLLFEDQTFSFETVMSHPSKVDFLKEAPKHGFNTYLYFICTQDPEINLHRISNRVTKGGHPVDPDKTIKRYFRSLELLYEAFIIADRAFVIDSSNKSREVIIEKKNQQIFILKDVIPEWVGKYLLDKIEAVGS